ncbi:MAG: hypothetical protein QXR74_05670, partial [Candidatus Bathyarchaeia archaeon]
EESFRSFLFRVAGVQAPPTKPEVNLEEKISRIIGVLEGAGLSVFKPAEIRPHVSFLIDSVKYISNADWDNVQGCLSNFIRLCEQYNAKRVFVWRSGERLNVGILINFEGIIELHYIEIDLS